MSDIYYINSDQFHTFFDSLKKEYKVFSPVAKEPNPAKETDYSYLDSPEGSPPVFNPYRCVQPLKTFFTYALDKAAEYFNPEESTAEGTPTTKISAGWMGG